MDFRGLALKLARKDVSPGAGYEVQPETAIALGFSIQHKTEDGGVLQEITKNKAKGRFPPDGRKPVKT